jgi:hypothetical protein
MLLDFRNETAFTGWGLQSIKEFLVGPGLNGSSKKVLPEPEKSHLPIFEHNALNTNK